MDQATPRRATVRRPDECRADEEGERCRRTVARFPGEARPIDRAAPRAAAAAAVLPRRTRPGGVRRWRAATPSRIENSTKIRRPWAPPRNSGRALKANVFCYCRFEISAKTSIAIAAAVKMEAGQATSYFMLLFQIDCETLRGLPWFRRVVASRTARRSANHRSRAEFSLVPRFRSSHHLCGNLLCELRNRGALATL